MGVLRAKVDGEWLDLTPGMPGPIGPMGPTGPRRTCSINSSTAYTLALVDENTLLMFNNVAAVTVTLPSDATVNFPLGAEVDCIWYGLGRPTFVAGAGAFANGTPGLKLRAQYSAATAKKVAVNTWVVIGDLSA